MLNIEISELTVWSLFKFYLHLKFPFPFLTRVLKLKEGLYNDQLLSPHQSCTQRWIAYKIWNECHRIAVAHCNDRKVDCATGIRRDSRLNGKFKIPRNHRVGMHARTREAYTNNTQPWLECSSGSVFNSVQMYVS